MEYFSGLPWPPDLCNPEKVSHGLATMLRAMGELPLPRGDGVRAYRLYAEPTWGRRCSIRLEVAASGWRVTRRRGFLPQDAAIDQPQEFEERGLTAVESAEVERALAIYRCGHSPCWFRTTG
ncbi:hypothetical protein GobsT_10980 [Gemmata obscuriglobus]|nr:hypothetical protein GobsT_10980 [Gemmata obscuriglobus]VTS01367.1 unnamed protein product [Gemmata obscuriglobus UQM 2246]